MNLHRLTLRAIGPYADEYTIDFAALGASGVFLLEGPTGSGKSTVIDAIVFGLYGVLAGETASVDRLHSHHASPGVEPFVELVFETSAGIHRVRRTPQWWRPKARGTGVTRANAGATLVRLTSPDAVDGDVVSTSAQEVGAEITRIVGLTRSQFVQTVVLPQGEFAKFLASSGEERRLVLQSLFGTEVYDRTTERLVDMRRAARQALADSSQAIDRALARLRESAGDDELTIESATASVDALAAEAIVAEALRAAEQVELDGARAERDRQIGLARLLERRKSLIARRVELDGRAVDRDTDRRMLVDARRAALVVQPLAAHRAVSVQRDEARAFLESLRARADADGRSDLVESDVEALQARRDRLVSEIAGFRGTVDLEAAFPQREAELARLQGEVADGRDGVVRLLDLLAGRAGERALLVQAHEAADSTPHDVDAATAAVAAAEAALTAARRVAELRRVASSTAERVETAAHEARVAVTTESDVRRRRIDGLAGQLATELEPGRPCVVCGSTEHPAPAVVANDHVSLADVETAEARRVSADRRLAEAAAAHSAAEARRDEAVAAADAVEIETATARLAASNVALSEARRAADDVVSTSGRLASFDVETGETERRLDSARLATAVAEQRASSAEASLAADRKKVDDDLAGRSASCSELVRELEGELEATTALREAAVADHRADVDLVARARDLDLAVSSSGFDDAAGAEAAALEPRALGVLEAAVSSYDADVAAVAAGLSEPDLMALPNDATADTRAAEHRLAEIDARYAESASAATRAVDVASRAGRALGGLRQAEAAAEVAAGDARAVVRMADVASASGPENLRGVTLGTYVLLRRFDDVVGAANVRLDVMSSGRYQLETSDEKESGQRARKTGLALAIRDNATDTTRDPKSFSGGETFYASLSLALGLADVVQAEAGGLDLGTLFVDEGFGTLDPETLDAVMSELVRLSQNGRVVGIVSHVEELKQRVADRIEVRRRPDGSSVLRSTAGV